LIRRQVSLRAPAEIQIHATEQSAMICQMIREYGVERALADFRQTVGATLGGIRGDVLEIFEACRRDQQKNG
jgi:hypothetical protein